MGRASFPGNQALFVVIEALRVHLEFRTTFQEAPNAIINENFARNTLDKFATDNIKINATISLQVSRSQFYVVFSWRVYIANNVKVTKRQ